MTSLDDGETITPRNAERHLHSIIQTGFSPRFCHDARQTNGSRGATIYAQATTPIYAVAEINVKDKDSYDKTLPKALDLIKAGGGKHVAGGYNKTKSIIGTPPPNRYVLIRYDGGAEAFDKVWNGGHKDWVEKEGSKYADFRLFNVEAVEMK